MSLLRRTLFLTFVLCTTSGLSTLLYNGARLGAFSKPDFRTSFRLRSNNGSSSFREVYTGQNQRPFHVRVYAKVLSGVNAGFCFEGVGAAQDSARKTGHSYGGLVFAYNSNYVRIWAPSSFKSNSNGKIIFVCQGWGGKKYNQRCDEALVVVEVWNIGPVPTFQTSVVVDARIPNRVFHEVEHRLAEIPERVMVRVTPLNKDSKNHGFWFNGISSSQNVGKRGYGGVIFAYNEKKIQLWLPSGTKNNGCVFVKCGWGGEEFTESTPSCMVYIFAWVSKFPVPSYTTEWTTLTSQGGQQNSFWEIKHMMSLLPSLVIVQGRSGDKGLIFEGTGAVMSTDKNLKGYGGILYAYDENSVRVWLPQKTNGTKNGYSIFVKQGWGNDQQLQQSHTVRLRVIVYASNCDGTEETVMQKGICWNFRYGSYHWQTGPWSKCSSICNKGQNSRKITACDVSASETVLSCGFSKDLCKWQSSSSASWQRVKDQGLLTIDGLSWNRPNDSYYAFATSNSSDNPVVFASPKFAARKSCRLSFNYKMVGTPSGILSVEVAEEGNSPEPSGWSMEDNQGGVFWRQGYAQLTKFSKLTQVLFKFKLREPENGRFPVHGNVSVDEVKLECASIQKKTVAATECKKHKVPSVGCIHLATEPTTKGPAFRLTKAVDNQRVVVSKGTIHQLIASYDFMVHATGEYVFWLHAYGTSTADNAVRFQIDNLDYIPWHTTYSSTGNRPIWTHYLYETFTLKPGVHTVRLSQLEINFKFSHLALTPKRLSTWAPLGMQSGYIPDSNLKAYPPSSYPAPKFGRLNGEEAWCSSDHNKGFVRMIITLPELALVSRIAVQGGQQIKKKTNNYWVTRFQVKLSVDGNHFTWYRISSKSKMFVGNSDANGIVEHELPSAALARKIEIYPYEWKNWICMRVELYGLYMTNSMCAYAGHEAMTSKTCEGNRNCGTNAECRPITKQSIIKTGSNDHLGGHQACHCHPGYHGDSCQNKGCHPNPCQNGGTCHSHSYNFTCSCPGGYHGPLCQHPCPVGKYGKNCVHQCVCGAHGSCDITTGHCSCERGYFGIACDQVCPRGYFGNDCKERCRCRNNGDCDHVSGACKCTAGWMGKSCDQPCTKNRWGGQCRNSCQCSSNAVTCNPVSGECVCKPGKTGRSCKSSCPAGSYGSQCTGTCQCSDHGTCDKADGNCTCVDPGWTGIKCDQPCPRGFYGVGCRRRCSCPENAECNSTSGECICGSGFSGSRCHLPCQENKWGPGCENRCQCAHNATCESTTGTCHCPAGWHGPFCNNNCPDGKWGSSCTNTCDCQNNASCDSLSGVCQCQPGRSGSKCEKPCPTGFYGPRCQNKCICNHGNSCEPVTGNCHCPPGWLGRTCAEACSTGYYGNRCSKNCSCLNGASCGHVSGSCTCTAGWTGPTCSQACPAGFYGNDCSRKCQCNKDNTKSCDHVTGRCHCKPGYVGARCSQACQPGHYGIHCAQQCDCKNGGECSPTDGKCTCLAGYYGDRCEHTCPAMRYGINCSKTCSYCVNNPISNCDPVTGKCLCSAGYYGYHCENRCPEGKYGIACALDCVCQNDAHCNHVNGTCECAAGFTGTKCDQPCPEGTFGNKCLGVCLCDNGGKCDAVTGECSCLAGYQGTRCTEVCPENWWGVECRNKCSCAQNHTMKCRVDTGLCECSAGYRGTTCDKFCDDGTYGQDCQHQCPQCSRHVAGPCYKIDGRCPCSAGYRGSLCDNDCALLYFGPDCRDLCTCKSHEVCHHVSGHCFPISSGQFTIMILENFTDMKDRERQRELKDNVGSLMSSNYDKYIKTVGPFTKRQIPSQSFDRYQNTTVTTGASLYQTTSSTMTSPPTSSSHDFVARILRLSQGLSSDGQYEVVVVTMLMFDGAVLLNGTKVKDVINSIEEDRLGEVLGSTYYSGSLYKESAASTSFYVQWITGIAGGLLLTVVLVILFTMCKRRRRHLKKLKSQKKKEKEMETEMEMKTRSFRHNGYRLAFDNPYYDVLAAMALDDDVEEDYINPLCDLESLTSHQGSDATVSTATECSIQKGGSLQSISYC